MAPKRTTSEKAALTQGAALAKRALSLRRAQLKGRAGAVARAMSAQTLRPSKASRASVAPVIPASTLRTLGAGASSGVLIAEGDSWFDYPGTDILSELEDTHLFEVEHVAHWGDRVEQMAYADDQLADFLRLLDKLLRRGQVPRAVLLSGGGNDIAGDSFEMLLNHALSPAPGLNDAIVSGVIDDRIRHAYITILRAVTDLCIQRLGQPVKIVVHGYAYPVPDGRGFGGGWWFLPGPWLKPGFELKGYGALTKRVALMQVLIDRFNVMLAGVAGLPDFAKHVTHVDLRPTLHNGSTYKNSWANELHPTKTGFASVAAKIAAHI